MPRTLIVVPCGQCKIWDRRPAHGPAPARDAYTGAPFQLNRRYAERFGDAWVILSARYGFIPPDFMIPGPYDVTFKWPRTRPIDLPALQRQIKTLHLDRFDRVIVLGGAAYRRLTCQAFAGYPVTLSAPTAGLPVGKAMRALKQAITAGVPLPDA
jgi:hypothetical protein